MKSGSGWVCFKGARVRFLASREISLTLPPGKWRETHRQEKWSSGGGGKSWSGLQISSSGTSRGGGIRKDNGPDGWQWCGRPLIRDRGVITRVRGSSPTIQRVPAPSGLGPPGSTRLTLKLINYNSLKKKIPGILTILTYVTVKAWWPFPYIYFYGRVCQSFL